MDKTEETETTGLTLAELKVRQAAAAALLEDLTNQINLLSAEKQACPICLEEIDYVLTLHCEHAFCAECLAHWVAKHKTCPICRGDIDLKTVFTRESEDPQQDSAAPDRRERRQRAVGSFGGKKTELAALYWCVNNDDQDVIEQVVRDAVEFRLRQADESVSGLSQRLDRLPKQDTLQIELKLLYKAFPELKQMLTQAVRKAVENELRKDGVLLKPSSGSGSVVSDTSPAHDMTTFMTAHGANWLALTESPATSVSNSYGDVFRRQE